MIGTYNTIDFGELYDSLQSELDRLRNEYRIADKTKAQRISDYNHMTTALLILREIEAK